MKVWIYLDGRQQGPFEMEELLDMPVNENTKVWFEGLPKWYPAGYLPQMRPLFDGSLAAARAANTPPPTPADAIPAAEVEQPEVEEPTVEQPEDTVTEVIIEEVKADEPAPEPAPAAQQPTVPAPCPPSYLVWGIILTICCCSPLGIGVIIASVLVGSNYASGNIAGAVRASEWAQWLIMATLAFGIVPLILLCIIL